MENPFREYLDGDDVVTGVGLMRTEDKGQVHLVAHVLVDYGATGPYTELFEKDWDGDPAFKAGFIYRRMSDVMLRVESVAQFESSCEKGGETHLLRGPCFYTDCASTKPDVDRFVETAEKNGIWILHLISGKHSYISAVTWPDGRVAWRRKRDRVDITMTDERSKL